MDRLQYSLPTLSLPLADLSSFTCFPSLSPSIYLAMPSFSNFCCDSTGLHGYDGENYGVTVKDFTVKTVEVPVKGGESVTISESDINDCSNYISDMVSSNEMVFFPQLCSKCEKSEISKTFSVYGEYFQNNFKISVNHNDITSILQIMKQHFKLCVAELVEGLVYFTDIFTNHSNCTPFINHCFDYFTGNFCSKYLNTGFSYINPLDSTSNTFTSPLNILFFTCIMLSHKFNADVTIRNESWAKAAYLPTSILMGFEKSALMLLDYSLYVNEEKFKRLYYKLKE
jgi:hypothetical protein